MKTDFRAEERPIRHVIRSLVLIFFVSLVGVTTLAFRRCLVTRNQSERQEINALRVQIEQLKQAQAMPALVLERYRNSIGYIVGIYDVAFPNRRPLQHTRISGTGFVVANGLIATNRHIAEPWYKDHDSEAFIAQGATPSLKQLLAYFPGSPTPINLGPVAISPDKDLAVVRMKSPSGVQLQPLPLSAENPNPGELVTVVGYPMGVFGMMVKAPTALNARLASRHDNEDKAGELAALSLIRPLATFGHLGDVVGDKLIYDAPTTHGASGGPVFNSRGEVVAVNAAYIDGFSGGTLGFSSQDLKPLIEEGQKNSAQTEAINKP